MIIVYLIAAYLPYNESEKLQEFTYLMSTQKFSGTKIPFKDVFTVWKYIIRNILTHNLNKILKENFKIDVLHRKLFVLNIV